jgi:hypothetical protein
MIVWLTVVYEYDNILVILIDSTLVIIITFVVKYESNVPLPKSNDPLPKLPLIVAVP